VANTATQLAQYALNISVPMQNAYLNGQFEPGTKGDFVTLLGAITLLAEAVIAINNSNTGGGTIPGSLLTGKWSAVQSPAAPIQT
jgi:hypothetical protein